MSQKSPEYRNGYGDAKADLLRLVKEALKSLHEACQNNGFCDPSEKDKELLRLREAELRRIRGMIKALKPKE